jgi:hypothetical protein
MAALQIFGKLKANTKSKSCKLSQESDNDKETCTLMRSLLL